MVNCDTIITFTESIERCELIAFLKDYCGTSNQSSELRDALIEELTRNPDNFERLRIVAMTYIFSVCPDGHSWDKTGWKFLQILMKGASYNELY